MKLWRSLYIILCLLKTMYSNVSGDILSPDFDWSIVGTPNSMLRGILGSLWSSRKKRAMITHTVNMCKFTMNAGAEHGRTSVHHGALQFRPIKHIP